MSTESTTEASPSSAIGAQGENVTATTTTTTTTAETSVPTTSAKKADAGLSGAVVDIGRYVGSLFVFVLAASFSAAGLVPCVMIYDVVDTAFGRLPAVATVPFLYGLWGFIYVVLLVGWKRVLWPRLVPGKVPLFSFRSVAWLTTGYLHVFIRKTWMWMWIGSPFLAVYFRAMGARIGRRVLINTTNVNDFDLITIGDDVVLGGDCTVIAHLLEGGQLGFAPVVLEKGAQVGASATVMPGVRLGAGAVLGASAVTTKEQQIPAREIWAGLPARFVKARRPAGTSSSTSSSA